MFDIEIDEETKEKIRAQVGIGTLIVFIAMVLVAAIAAGVLINTAGFLQSKSEQTGQQSGDQVTNRLQVLQATGLKTPADNSDSDPLTAEDSASIGAVQLVATKAPGANDIDLTGLTMQWVDDSGTYDLVHERVYSGNVDGEFAHEAIKDEDDSLNPYNPASPVINSGDDRALIVIDIGEQEAADDIGGYNDTDDDPDTDGDPNAGDAGRYQGQADNTIRFDKGDDNKYYQQDTNNNADDDTDEGGLEEGSSASIRITTASGTATTVQLVVPESLSGASAAEL